MHWFPRAKKAGGWVYKSWRDWNAESNLSQAQVKRVHGKGILETIGIKRTIMKANGTPTVHYRLDENQLIQRLAEFLEIMPLYIKLWMCPEPPNEDGQDHLSNDADSDQLNQSNQLDSYGEDEPIRSAEIAQSITDSDSQTRQHNDYQSTQHNRNSAVVVDTERGERAEILQSLGKLGISYLKAKELIEKHGQKRIAQVAKHAQDQKCINPAGYVIRALKENWTFWSAPEKEDYTCGNGHAYITGKYAAFIQH